MSLTVTTIAAALAFAAFQENSSPAAEPETEELYAPTGTRIARPVRRLTAPEREAVRILRSFGECTVKTNEIGARRLLATPDGSAAAVEIANGLAGKDNKCLMARQMRLKLDVFRGIVAEVFYLRENPQPAPSSTTKSSLRPSFAEEDSIGRFSDCAAATDAAALDAVIRTKAGSQLEVDLMNQIVQRLRKCIPRGTTTVHAITFRAKIAEALYQRYTSAAGAVGGAGQQN